MTGTSTAHAATSPAAPRAAEPGRIAWLEKGGLGSAPGTTFGVAWPKGAVKADETFALTAGDGAEIPVQSWPTAYWPDGTLKWTAHAAAREAAKAEDFTILPGKAAATPAKKIAVKKSGSTITVDTGTITATIGTKGSSLIRSLTRDTTEIARNGRLVLHRQQHIDEPGGTYESYESDITEAHIEQDGPIRAVIRIDGKHRHRGHSWLPFSIRLYFYAGAESFRMVHTITYDGDQQKDFIRGLGVRFDVPMRDKAYDRHIRIAGEDKGFLTEAVQGVTGLRRDPGEPVRKAQIKGEKLPDPSTWDQRVTTRLQYIPHWGDYTLAQLSADGFTLRKRTKHGHGWIPAGGGGRASGFGYVGGVSGGLSFGLRDFWQKHPAQLDIRSAQTDAATVTLWLYSPEAQPMDLRFYHDGMGQDTYDEQLEGLEITYEDYEPKFGTPYGIARTSELMFWANDTTPSADTLVEQAAAVRTPPQLAA
ncbi:Tat pathway signal sequence domain protein, partial [Streptomyces sp. A7024]|nr:Tat pathway signal sequence domain protein [Streptomyces coryli]